MATLPDLDTSKISVVGYWNVLDGHGITSFTPSDITSYSDIAEISQYDNGYEGRIETTSYNGRYNDMPDPNADYYFRVKSDGWFITWMDRDENYGIDLTSGQDPKQLVGPYMLISQSSRGETTTPPSTMLSTEIFNLANELSNSGSITMNASDVGYYSYQWSDATTFSMITGVGNNGNSINTTVQYDSSITRHKDTISGATAPQQSGVYFDGTVIAQESYDGSCFGAKDAQDAGLIPNSNTSYPMERGNAGNDVCCMLLSFWS